MGLVIPTTKSDAINICRRLMEFGFMWFVVDQKLSNNIAERFNSMVVDLKALIPAPTQKKARRGSK